MKFKHVRPKNARQMVPAWIIDPFQMARLIDQVLVDAVAMDRSILPATWDRPLSFWLEIERCDQGWNCSLKLPLSGDAQRKGQVIILADDCTLSFPLNAMLKGSDDLEGSHCVYSHTLLTEAPLAYVGISKRPWFTRYAEHKSSAERGSSLVFHAALARHSGCRIQHRVLLTGVNFAAAMQYEEEFVDAGTLYPLGLNMIPGGKAGLAYLARFGGYPKTAAERDSYIESISSRKSIQGAPNPLCAARWTSDQDYVNRVICGHSGRLTVEQVRTIRRFSSFGRGSDRIAGMIGVPLNRVQGVLSGKTYGRIA